MKTSLVCIALLSQLVIACGDRPSVDEFPSSQVAADAKAQNAQRSRRITDAPAATPFSFDSVQCKVGLLKASVAESSRPDDVEGCYSQYEKEDFKKLVIQCAGPNMNQQTSDHRQETLFFNLAENISLRTDKVFNSAGRNSSKSLTTFRAKIETITEVVEQEYSSERPTLLGCVDRAISAGDHQERLFIACRPVKGCVSQ